MLLDGEDVSRLPLYRIAERVGSVFQNPRTQFFNVDADSEIAFGLENEAVPQTQMAHRVAETAQALRIEDLLGRSIFALSGGEKQKIAFASVYAMNPSVYLLDEPSSNLDRASIDTCGSICGSSKPKARPSSWPSTGSITCWTWPTGSFIWRMAAWLETGRRSSFVRWARRSVRRWACGPST